MLVKGYKPLETSFKKNTLKGLQEHQLLNLKAMREKLEQICLKSLGINLILNKPKKANFLRLTICSKLDWIIFLLKL